MSEIGTLTDVQRAVLLKLAKNDPVTVTEVHQWWFKHMSRARVKSAVNWLEILGMVRVAGIGDRNAPTYTTTDEGRAVFANTANTTTTEESQ